MGIKKDLTRKQKKEMKAVKKGSYQLIRDQLMTLLGRGYTQEQIAAVLKKSERQIVRYVSLLREERQGDEYKNQVEDQVTSAKRQNMEIAITQLHEMLRDKTDDKGVVIKPKSEPAEIIKAALNVQKVITEYEELCARIGVMQPRTQKIETPFPALKLVIEDAAEPRDGNKMEANEEAETGNQPSTG